ncbi:MAG: enoyl-CoA hydratase/isomerase family protein [Caulobacteraceae bacterium]|nr:enoyl-CoA hydratase/isomerase family protein [Caulobacteraceae bacterium]
MERTPMSFEVSRADGITTVTLSRPPVNALDLPAIEDLRALFAELRADPPDRGVILTGKGRCFSAGVDTRAFSAYSAESRARMILGISAMVAELYAIPCPVVTAAPGHALGGGLVLMLCGDVRLAVDDDAMKLGLTEARAGVPFPAGPLVVLSAELSPERIRRLTLTSQTLSPTQLFGQGVIDELCSPDDLMDSAIRTVRETASQPAFSLVKAQVRQHAISRLSQIVASGEDPLVEALAAQGRGAG